MEEGKWKKMKRMHCIHSHFLGKILAKPFQKITFFSKNGELFYAKESFCQREMCNIIQPLPSLAMVS